MRIETRVELQLDISYKNKAADDTSGPWGQDKESNPTST